jgi:DNA topoisomerase-3
LPLLPERFRLVVLPSGHAQYRIVSRLLRDSTTRSVIAATDAGREGELIFRYIYEHSRCQKPWQRLWLSSMTPAAIRAAFDHLQPGVRYDGLAAAARARSQADWLVGMNLSRAYTLTSGTLFSVGRVQTPTLAMIVARDREIREFVPEPYLEVQATFEGQRGVYRGTYYAPPPEGVRDAQGRLRVFKPLCARLPPDGQLANAIAARARTGNARVAMLDRSLRRTPPPSLYDLTELQRHANRLYGYSAQQTLEAAQSLYEQYKLLSYPRTDSRHLSASVASTLPEVVQVIAGRYPGLVAAGTGERRLGARFVDDSRVGEHHALIPTSGRPDRLPPHSAAARIYDLVCRRLLMAWHAEQVEAITRVLTEVCPREGGAPDLFATQGTALENPGWSVLEVTSARKTTAAASAPAKIPPGLSPGEPQRVSDVVIHRKQTTPPSPFTEATLLTAMETAGRTLEDRALIVAMREAGLGTPATRAATIETLLARGYLSRHGKLLQSTPLGAALVTAVHPLVRSPEMTGRWEQRLSRMEHGQEALAPFMHDIARYVAEVVAAEATKPAAPRQKLAKTQFARGKRGTKRKRAWAGAGKARSRTGKGARATVPKLPKAPKKRGGGTPSRPRKPRPTET